MGFKDFIEKHKAMLFYNLVVVVGEELVCALTQLEPCLASWEPGPLDIGLYLPSCPYVVSLCGSGT